MKAPHTANMFASGLANEWQGMNRMAEVARARTGQVLTARVAVPRIMGPGIMGLRGAGPDNHLP